MRGLGVRHERRHPRPPHLAGASALPGHGAVGSPRACKAKAAAHLSLASRVPPVRLLDVREPRSQGPLRGSTVRRRPERTRSLEVLAPCLLIQS